MTGAYVAMAVAGGLVTLAALVGLFYIVARELGVWVTLGIWAGSFAVTGAVIALVFGIQGLAT